MAARPIPAEVLSETLNAVKLYGSVTKAAEALGVNRLTFSHRYQVALASVDAPSCKGKPDNAEKAHQDEQVFHPQPPSNCRIGRVSYKDEGPIKVTVIGDLHVAPGQDLSRLKWIARHIGETRPDHIVQIGDWSSFDSVSSHDPIGSIKAKYRPSIRQDIECLQDSLAVFDRELGPSTIPRLVTLGNHEDRIRRYQDLRAELEDGVWLDVLQHFAQHRWKTTDFGKVVFVGGVGFTHVPLNVMGKPHSSPNIIGHNLAHDLVRGHSHKAMYSSIPKIGENVGVTLIDVGTSLPHGHVEPYAKLSQTGWYWGIHDVIIRGGRIDDFARISMKTLEARYA